jgi:hypothetical protein
MRSLTPTEARKPVDTITAGVGKLEAGPVLSLPDEAPEGPKRRKT